MSSPNTYPCSSSALPSSPQPTSVVASSSSTEVPASSALAPVRGNKRIYAGFVAAPSLEEVADSVVSDSGDESETTSQELARLRSEIHSSQAAQATAEASFTKEIMRRESLQMACSSARREMKQTQTEVHRLRERQSSVLQELDAFNVQVDVHKELYQRLENCIKSAEDEFQRLTQYTSPQKKVFTATVATNTSQIRRLHHLLSDSDIADDSANTRLERRNEDIRDQVKRFSTCELNWELLDVSGQTRDILKRLYVMKDSTMSGENFAAGLAWIACREGDDLELSQDDRAANARKNSPGTSPITKSPAASNAAAPGSTASSGKAASPASLVLKSTSSGVSKCKSQSRPTKTPPKKNQSKTLRASPTSSQQPVGSSSISASAARPVSSALVVPVHASLGPKISTETHVSQRAPPLARLKGFWRTFRGYGPEEDVDLGFSLWERDYWISARTIELFLSTGYRVLEEDSILPVTTKAQLRLALDEAKGGGRREDTDLRFAAITPEILFEPSMPGYSFEYLTWIPGSSYWLSHVLALDAAEPWHSGWVDAPAQHHYNTTFAPCNPGFPLFVPTGQTRETVGCQIQVNPVLTSSEIAPDWDVDFRVPSAAPTAPAPAGDSAAMAEESSTIDDANLL
ncbi:hypothetical protein PC115_g19129 [Phytophthora cactorum]|uniref:Uncharacterized protein n=2 Tax=Phytophthora cactorum TaxID=29920 RepID=A0A8T1AWB6_9STRA|nr:hypothetical protein PC115_g19129 [Phytophthora cactorum]